MSVLIKKMGMPKRCVDCEKFSGEGYQCPFIKVPVPHGRLIDADELKKNRINLYGTTDVVLMVDIENAPTIIEAEEDDDNT